MAGHERRITGPGNGPTGVDGRVEAWMAALTLEEKVSLLAGADAWRLPALPQHAIPALVLSDGPSGVRGGSFLSGSALAFPCGTSLASTWDPALVGAVGRALGAEAARLGVHVLLGPTVNLHRHPLGGRNFESFSEDPVLTAAMARAYVEGVQSQGVGCCVKHLVCNDTEFERFTIDVRVDETTLRESYLVPFHAAVAAGAWAVMASYNKLNGTHATEHRWLLDEVLRGQWGFDGVVVSDWFATHSTGPALAAGLDVEMPGPPRQRGAHLVDAVRRGAVAVGLVDRAARRVLRLVARTAAAVDPGPDTPDAPDTPDTPERPAPDPGVAPGNPASDPGVAMAGDDVGALLRTAAARGMVLLKNRGVLPFAASTLRTVALVGPGADVGECQGGGSAHVNTASVPGVLAALRAALGPSVDVRFEPGCVTADWPRPLQPPDVTTPTGAPGIEVAYLRRADPSAPPLGRETAGRFHLVWIGPIVAGTGNEDLVVRAAAVLHPAASGRHELRVAGSGLVRLSVDGERVVERHWSSDGLGGTAAGGEAARATLDLQRGRPTEVVAELLPGPGTGVSDLTVSLVPPAPPDLMDRAVALARRSDAVVVVAQSPPGWESEGHDRPGFHLPGDQDALIERVAAANSSVVVAVNTGAPVAMPWIDRVPAVLQTWFPGQAFGPALADVLTGVVNPSGRLPTTFPRSVADVASAPFYPGAGGVSPYREGSGIGYRGGVADPLFPFGHGLSYSTFTLGPPSVAVVGSGAGARYEVRVPVAHTAGPPGSTVVQLYVADGSPGRPALALKGFDRVTLDPGATGTARIDVAVADLCTWDGGGWRPPAGPVRARIGTSSADLPASLSLPPPGE